MNNPLQLIDTHCHLDFPEFDADRTEVLTRAKDEGVYCVINVGSSLRGSKQSVDLAFEHEGVYAVVGVHPHDADSYSATMIDQLRKLAGNKKVVAIGETGLDYYRNLSCVEKQRELFKASLSLAKEISLPVVIHSRDAQKETIEILKEFMPINAVVHCFSGGEEFLTQSLELGLFISFTCNLTYKKAQNLRDMVKSVPLDRLMLETDAPYLSPEGFRGKRNEPRQVRLLAEYVAQLIGVSVEEVALRTTQNAKSFFKLS